MAPALHWGWPVAGGLLIGLSAAIYLVANGRVTGISGMIATAARLSPGGRAWLPALFLLGLIAGAFVAGTWIRPVEASLQAGLPWLVVAGLLVGYGTRLGAGCTSGHGICGLARLSPRSIVATLVFMAVAVATVYVVRHVGGAA